METLMTIVNNYIHKKEQKPVKHIKITHAHFQKKIEHNTVKDSMYLKEMVKLALNIKACQLAKKYHFNFNLSVYSINNFNETYLMKYEKKKVNVQQKNKTNKINSFRSKPSLLLHNDLTDNKRKNLKNKPIKPSQIHSLPKKNSQVTVSESISNITKKYHSNYKSYDDRSIQEYLNEEVKHIKLTYSSLSPYPQKNKKKMMLFKENNITIKSKGFKHYRNNDKKNTMGHHSTTTTHSTGNLQLNSLNYIFNKSCQEETPRKIINSQTKKNKIKKIKDTFRKSSMVNLFTRNNQKDAEMLLQPKMSNNIMTIKCNYSPLNSSKSLEKRTVQSQRNIKIKESEIYHTENPKEKTISNYNTLQTKKIEYNATESHNHIERIFKIVIDLRTLLSCDTINDNTQL